MLYANGKPEGSKVSRLTLWKQVEKQTGVTPESLLERPPFPNELSRLWFTFTKLAGSKESITYSELESYTRLMQEFLTPWQIDVIFRLEAVRNG